MSLSVTCPTCQARVRLPAGSAGRRFRCPKCKAVFAAPAPPPPPPPPAAAFGFTNEPIDPAPPPFDEGPLPLSPAARRSPDPFNPFDDGTSSADDEDRRKPRYYKPKDDYNPFADPSTAGPAGGAADPGAVFDFGAPDPNDPPPGDAGGLDFGPSDPPDDSPRRRRR